MRSKTLALSAAALVLAAVSLGSAAEDPKLTLDDAISLAARQSPILASARERVAKSRNAVREANSLDNLRLDGKLGYSHTSPVSEFELSGPDGPVKVQLRPPSSITANATFARPLDISGKIGLAKGLAKLQLDIQTHAEAQVLQQLIGDVKSSFLGVLRAKAAVGTASSALTAAQERLRIANANFDAGTAPRFDVTRAEVDVANISQSLTQAGNAVQLAKAALNRLLGQDVGTAIEPVGEEPAVQPVTVDIPALTEDALKKRPEMLQALAGVELARKGVSLARKDDRPTLGLYVSTDWTSAVSALSSNSTTYTAGASLSWPIWTGGQTSAKVDGAKNDLELAKLGQEQARLAIQLDVRSAALNVMEASSRVGVARSAVGLAEDALALAQVRYREGVSTQVEVTDSEAALTQARSFLVNAVYDYVVAQAQLERATCSQPEFDKLTTHAAAESR